MRAPLSPAPVSSAPVQQKPPLRRQDDDALFGKSGAEADFTGMAQDVSVLTISQTGDDAEDDYTQEECTEAAQ